MFSRRMFMKYVAGLFGSGVVAGKASPKEPVVVDKKEADDSGGVFLSYEVGGIRIVLRLEHLWHVHVSELYTQARQVTIFGLVAYISGEQVAMVRDVLMAGRGKLEICTSSGKLMVSFSETYSQSLTITKVTSDFFAVEYSVKGK